jgi:hypothetical protein
MARASRRGLGAADGVFAGLVLATAAARDDGQPVRGQRATRQHTVGVVAGEQQCTQPIDYSGLGRGEVPASAEQNA